MSLGIASDKPLRGRPRTQGLDQRIMDAAWNLLGKTTLAELTMHEIAKQAGTTRPAIYRRWKSLEDIVIDAFLFAVNENVPTPLAASPPEQLHAYILSLAKFLNSRVGSVIAEILGRAQSDPKLMAKFRDVYLLPRRNHAREIICNGQVSGHFRADLDSDLIIDLYAGPIYFRAFAQHARMDKEFAHCLADQVLNTIMNKKLGR